MRQTDIENAEHYTWGDACHGWHFLKTDNLSVIRERMPQGTTERLHYHEKSQQFFYILSGEAAFQVEGAVHRVIAGQGMAIMPGERHKIYNDSAEMLEFIVISSPKSHGDRMNLD